MPDNTKSATRGKPRKPPTPELEPLARRLGLTPDQLQPYTNVRTVEGDNDAPHLFPERAAFTRSLLDNGDDEDAPPGN